jgi:hypothetical protein
MGSVVLAAGVRVLGSKLTGAFGSYEQQKLGTWKASSPSSR